MFRFGHFRTFRYKNPLHVNPRKIKNSDRYEQSCSWKWKQNYSGMLQVFFLERESVSRVPSSLCTWLFQHSKSSVCVCYWSYWPRWRGKAYPLLSVLVVKGLSPPWFLLSGGDWYARGHWSCVASFLVPHPVRYSHQALHSLASSSRSPSSGIPQFSDFSC